MKWLKYQHKHSSGRSAWQWKPLDDNATEESVRDDGILSDITDEYSYSEKYSGIDFEIVDKPPPWVITMFVRAARERLDAAFAENNRWQAYLHETTIDRGNGLGYEECKQCVGATAAPAFNRGADENRPCPSCGREVVRKTLNFWLDPADTDAVKLLGSLVEQGERSVKSKKFRVPVEPGDEEEAYERLGKLGLAGGSSYQNTYKIYATERGKAEWLKHKGTAP